MIFNKAIRNVNYQDILDLITRREEESFLLDYKAEINYTLDKDKKELCKDVSSFANSKGGVLIYGIEQEVDDNSPPKPKKDIPPIGIEPPNVEAIESIISNGIYPRVSFEINLVGIDNSTRFILIIGVAVSYNAPHMVISHKDFRYYKRGNYKSEMMNEAEVRELYRRSEDMLEKLKDLIKKRRTLIYDELNQNLKNMVTYSFVISPMILQNELVSFDNTIVTHIHDAYTRDIVLCPGLTPSICGYYADNTYSEFYPEQHDIDKFIEICRNGLIQSSGKINIPDKILNPHNIKADLINLVRLSKELYENNKYYGSVLFDLNIKGIKNHKLQLKHGQSNIYRRSDEILIETTKNTDEMDIKQIVDELLNRVFNAFGKERHDLDLGI